MVKLLLSTNDVQQSETCSASLANDKNLEIIKTFDGISTLEEYCKIEPNIFVLDTGFSDITSTEILDKLSLSRNEKYNCNTIITTNSIEEQLRLDCLSKIYRILSKPYDIDVLRKTIYNMCNENEYPQLDDSEIKSLFVNLGVPLTLNGTDYLVKAISHCYYFPYYLKSLDSLLDYLVKIYANKSETKTPIDTETIRSSIRSVLRAFVINKNIVPYNCSLLKYFDNPKGVTPKRFIEVIVTYFHRIKRKNKK